MSRHRKDKVSLAAAAGRQHPWLGVSQERVLLEAYFDGDWLPGAPLVPRPDILRPR